MVGHAPGGVFLVGPPAAEGAGSPHAGAVQVSPDRAHFDCDKWTVAFEQTGIDPAFYAHRQRPLEELLPWDHIGSGFSRETLQAERARMLAALDGQSS